MEYCQKGSLEDLINDLNKQKKKIDEQIAWKYLSQLIFTFDYLHSNRVLHKDLKPSNIFLKDGEIRVGDFGLAKALDAKQSFSETMKGTLEYAAPELYKHGQIRSSGDIYGIGISIYELLTLHLPFQGNDFEIQNNITSDSVLPKPIKEPFSPKMKEIVLEMLNKDPLKRKSSSELIKIPEINVYAKQYAQEMITTATGKELIYLNKLLQDADTKPNPLPPRILNIPNQQQMLISSSSADQMNPTPKKVMTPQLSVEQIRASPSPQFKPPPPPGYIQQKQASPEVVQQIFASPEVVQQIFASPFPPLKFASPGPPQKQSPGPLQKQSPIPPQKYQYPGAPQRLASPRPPLKQSPRPPLKQSPGAPPQKQASPGAHKRDASPGAIPLKNVQNLEYTSQAQIARKSISPAVTPSIVRYADESARRSESPTVYTIIPIDSNKVLFETRNNNKQRKFRGFHEPFLEQLIQVEFELAHTVTIAPEIVAGAGVVQIVLKFGDLPNRNRDFRQSVGYCGSDGLVVHSKGDPETCISGNLKFGNNEDVIAEVDMTVDREKRTLHFFVQRRFKGTSVQIVSMRNLTQTSVGNTVEGSKIIEW
ncbi:MAG: putative cmgc ck2 family [Streblomastix strix]|uniref:non-specific serine/threonine protein kinase n=1 Tax=Streblomastix strix TaxID=222440 RepID=A0A5J4WAC6_9EUKA|nr:MAG: putative cmgc ck2 family [Streblomastix strix]